MGIADSPVDSNQNDTTVPTTSPQPVSASPTPQSPGTSSLNSTPTSSPDLDIIKSSSAAFFHNKWCLAGLILLAAIATAVARLLAPIYGILVILAGLLLMKYAYKNDIFEAFAIANNFNYQEFGEISEQTGIMFYVGYDRLCEHVVYGMYQRWPFYLFLYTYTLGEEQNSHTYHRTVLALNFLTPLPAFFLRKHKLLEILHEEGEAIKAFGYTEKIELEGDFSDHFQVYIEPGTHVDVLTILTPDVMELLVRLDKLEIEMTDSGDFYVYYHGNIKNKQGLLDLYTIVEAIIPKIGRDTTREQELLAMSRQ